MLPFTIAWRFLTSSKGQSILIVLGIAVGVSVQIYVGSLIGSLQVGLVEDTIGNSSQITILPEEDNVTISNWQSIETAVGSIEGVTYVSPVVEGRLYGGTMERQDPIILRGFDYEKANDIYGLDDSLVSGGRPGTGEALVGIGFADTMGIDVGDPVSIFLANGTYTNLTVTGVFDLKVALLNDQWVVSTIADVQDILGHGMNVTSIEMQVTDVFEAENIAVDVERVVAGEGVVVENWMATNEQLLSALSAQSASSLMIQVFVMISVVIAIASVLAITVMQKRKQIGIIKAMGMDDRKAGTIFVYEGAILGIGGSMIGVVLGLGLFLVFALFVTNPDGSRVVEPIIDWTFVTISGIIAMLASILASAIPARKTSKLDPMEVIRDE